MILQEKLIKDIIEKSKIDDRIDSTMMYGSFTQGCGDAFSDVEFYIFMKDNEIDNFNSEEWISDIYPIYTHFFNEFGTEVVIFKNMIRGEFHFLPEKEMSIIEDFKSVGYFPDLEAMCVCDKNGNLKKHLSTLSNCEVERKTLDNVKFVIDNLINAVLLGINVLKRGEVARSLESLWFAQKYYLQLIRLLENKTNHWVNPTKQLEKEISDEFYERYILSTSNLDKVNILTAYSNIIDNLIHIMSLLEFEQDSYTSLLSELRKYI